jgi:hypothetical protein
VTRRHRVIFIPFCSRSRLVAATMPSAVDPRPARGGTSMPIRRVLYCAGVLPTFLLVGDPREDTLLPLWCGKTTEIIASLQKQSYVSRRREEIGEQTHEWFVGPREVIVLEHNADGTSCVAAEGEWPPRIQARP